MYYLRKVTVGIVTTDKLFGYAARMQFSGAWKPLHAIEIDLEPGTPGVKPVVIRGISVAVLSDPRLIVVCATLQNHDGVGGSANNPGFWAKILNIETGNWILSVPLNVNENYGTDHTQSAIVALPGLKFIVAYIMKAPEYAVVTQKWDPASSSDVITNSWTKGAHEEVYTSVMADEWEFHDLFWLKMPKESKVLLTMVVTEMSNRTKGRMFDTITGAIEDVIKTPYIER